MPPTSEISIHLFVELTRAEYSLFAFLSRETVHDVILSECELVEFILFLILCIKFLQTLSTIPKLPRDEWNFSLIIPIQTTRSNLKVCIKVARVAATVASRDELSGRDHVSMVCMKVQPDRTHQQILTIIYKKWDRIIIVRLNRWTRLTELLVFFL